MSLDDEWNAIRKPQGPVVGGILRATLLAGSAAIALALLAIPSVERFVERRDMLAGNAGGLDPTTTGSISGAGDTYTIRRSVLQRSPQSVCIIRADGARSGEC